MNLEAQRPERVVPAALLAGYAPTLAFQLDVNIPGTGQVDLNVALARVHALDLGLGALGFTQARTLETDLEGHTVVAELYYDGRLNVFLFPICFWFDPECTLEEGWRSVWVRPSAASRGVGHD